MDTDAGGGLITAVQRKRRRNDGRTCVAAKIDRTIDRRHGQTDNRNGVYACRVARPQFICGLRLSGCPGLIGYPNLRATGCPETIVCRRLIIDAGSNANAGLVARAATGPTHGLGHPRATIRRPRTAALY